MLMIIYLNLRNFCLKSTVSISFIYKEFGMKFKMSFGAALALFSFACAEQNAAANSASGENLGDIEVVE